MLIFERKAIGRLLFQTGLWQDLFEHIHMNQYIDRCKTASWHSPSLAVSILIHEFRKTRAEISAEAQKENQINSIQSFQTIRLSLNKIKGI